MKTARFGPSDIITTRLIYGCMRIPGVWSPAQVGEAETRRAFAALDAAWAAGFRHFDHADIYCGGACERLFGEWLRDRGHARDSVVITSKCGIRWAGDSDLGEAERLGRGASALQATHRYDFSKRHILRSCELSLERLGVGTIDVYLLHRPDLLMNPAEVAEAFAELHASGKVRRFGVSNFTPEHIELLLPALDAALPAGAAALVCNQVRLNPLETAMFEGGPVLHMMRRGITPTSWSVIDAGRLVDASKIDDDRGLGVRRLRVLEALRAEAARLGTTPLVVAHAWLLAHPAGIQPIVGTTDPARITETALADGVEIDREAWYRVYLAGRGSALP